jgi:hypothetical protein
MRKLMHQVEEASDTATGIINVMVIVVPGNENLLCRRVRPTLSDSYQFPAIRAALHQAMGQIPMLRLVSFSCHAVIWGSLDELTDMQFVLTATKRLMEHRLFSLQQTRYGRIHSILRMLSNFSVDRPRRAESWIMAPMSQRHQLDEC